MCCCCCCCIAVVVSDSVRPQRRQPTRLPHPWDSGNVSVQQLKFFTVLTYILENDHKIAQNIDFGVTNKFQQIGKFTNTESINNDGLCVCASHL